ncbi:MAG TPA: TadE/TadG family type IV pilus assembly protein [Allosphingosinicella sp.]|nr:TadE/TadG family type IV pilus assembly protein [Allosphingosinicella sp.]
MRLPHPSLARDERGTSLIEFGFLAPFLAVLAMGIIDLSRGLAERFAIQQAVNRGLELVQARPAVAGAEATDLDYGFVVEEVEEAAGDDATVTMTRWLECNGVVAANVTGTCAAGQDSARYLRIRVAKDFQAEFYYATIPMTATGAVRTQ